MDPIINKNAERFIPVAMPDIGREEQKYLNACIEDNWISQGKRVEEFEIRVAGRIFGKAYGSACNSGTTALHLALHVCDVEEGDEVVIPNLTMIALANAVLLSGAIPVFADSDANSDVGNVNLGTIKEKITSKTKAVIVVHTYGEVIRDIENIAKFCKDRDIKLIEDCAECHTATVNGRLAGSFGDLAICSFYSNKNMTTGEGGMVLTDDKRVKDRLDRVRMHAFTPGKHFCHTERAFGYRMTDMQAAIGLGQLEKLSNFMRNRKYIRRSYENLLLNPNFKMARLENGYQNTGVWVLPILCESEEVRDNIRQHIADRGIDSRTYFQPMHEQSFLKKYSGGDDFPVSTDLARRGFYLPLYPRLSNSEVEYISEAMNSYEKD